MKKVFSILIVVLLLFIYTGAYADSEMYSLEPSLANAIGYTAEEWFQSEKNRALLTVILALEYSSYDKSFDMSCLYSDTSYVAYAKEYPGVMVCMFDDDNSHTVMYMPWLKTAAIPETINGTSEKAIEMSFEFNGYKYEKNSKDALMAAVTYVSGALKVMMDN